jgi:hypothetical protein
MKRLQHRAETMDRETKSPIQEPVKQSSSGRQPAPTAGVAGKPRLHNFSLWNHPGRNSTGLRADSSTRGTHNGVGFGRGSKAMWIVMYIAMVASLRAMGLAPSMVPVRTDEDRPPFGEI